MQNVPRTVWRSSSRLLMPISNWLLLGGCVSPGTGGAWLASLKGVAHSRPLQVLLPPGLGPDPSRHGAPGTEVPLCLLSEGDWGGRPDASTGAALTTMRAWARAWRAEVCRGPVWPTAGRGCGGGREGTGAGAAPGTRQEASGPSRRTLPGTGLRASAELAPRSPGPAPGAPPPGAPGWLEPAATRGDLPRAASLKPLLVPAPAGWSRRQRRGEAGAVGRDAAGPPRPGRRLSPHQVTSIPSRRTRFFTGKRAPACSPGAKPPSSPSCAG